MPLIHHPVTGATVDVPQAAVRHWTGPAGWQLVDVPAKPVKRRRRRAPASTPPPTTPTVLGGDEDGPDTDSSTTEHTRSEPHD